MGKHLVAFFRYYLISCTLTTLLGTVCIKKRHFLGENHLWEVKSRKDEEGAYFSLWKR